MVTFLWIIVILTTIIVLGYLLMVNAFSNSMKPNIENDSIHSLKLFLGFDFGNQYKVIKHISRNNHPDKPLHLSILLSEEVFSKVHSYVSNLEDCIEESLSEDKGIRYIEDCTNQSNCFIKKYKASYINPDLTDTPFFYSDLTVNFNQKTLKFNKSSC